MGSPQYLCTMFVHRKRNKSGSFSVIVKQKGRHSRANKVVKIIGTSSYEGELQELERRGWEYIDSLRGPLLPMDFHDPFEDGLEKFLSGISNTHIQVIGPELIYGSLYDRIGYGELHNDMFRHLVICRLFNPGSKLRTVEYLRRYLNKEYDVEAIYKFLDNLCYRKDKDCKKDSEGKPIKPDGEDMKAHVERISYAWTKKKCGGSVSVVFYDMTTLYFEAAQEDDLRKTGFSKDGKHACPQIFLGLLVAPGGTPIGYEIYEGNIHEGKTLIPVIEALAKKHGFDHPIVVADAGLLSKANSDELQKNGYEYIIGARVKNESDAVKQAITDMDLQYGDVKALDKGDGIRLVVSKSEKRAKKDAHARKKGMERLEKRFNTGKLTKANINRRGYNKYLKMDGDVTITIDKEKYEADAVWDGVKGHVTNTRLAEKDVLSNYSNLWFIERAFRMDKGDLRARPIFHRLHNRIEVHICICFTAYTIMLELERLLKQAKSEITIYQAGYLTKTMYQLNYQTPKTHRRKSVILQMDSEQQELYDIVSRNVPEE